jgi:DNA polymerase elongation subunit (family B)
MFMQRSPRKYNPRNGNKGRHEKSADWSVHSEQAGFDLFDDSRDDDKRLNASFADASDYIVDIREFDVPYHVRVMIDMSTFPTPSQNPHS